MQASLFSDTALLPVYSTPTPRRRKAANPARKLREAIAPYVDVAALQQITVAGGDIYEALRSDTAPPEVQAMLQLLAALLRPAERQQITSPTDVAALLMVEMSHLPQEQVRVVNLDTKNRVQSISMVYQQTLNCAQVRISEIFRDAIRLNSAAIIVAHQHPSGDPTPSPEDVLITRQIVEAGKLLDVNCLDHLVIGHGRYVSMRKKGLGFPKK